MAVEKLTKLASSDNLIKNIVNVMENIEANTIFINTNRKFSML